MDPPRLRAVDGPLRAGSLAVNAQVAAWGGATALVLIASALDLSVALRPGLAPVPVAAIAAAKVELEARHRPGTLIVHSPLLGVSEVSALGAIAARPDLPAAPIRARRRVLLLDRSEVPMGGFGVPSEVVALQAGLAIKVFEPEDRAGGQLSLFDLADGLGPTTLSIERPVGQVVSRCSTPRAEGGFSCPGQADWLYAAPRELRIDGADARCVWAHPTTGGAVVLEIPPPPQPTSGHRLEVEVASALTDDAVRMTGDGATVRTRVVQAAKSLGQLVRDNRIGWKRARYSVAAGQPIRLEVTAARDGRRHHCLDARVWEVPEPESRP